MNDSGKSDTPSVVLVHGGFVDGSAGRVSTST